MRGRLRVLFAVAAMSVVVFGGTGVFAEGDTPSFFVARADCD